MHRSLKKGLRSTPTPSALALAPKSARRCASGADHWAGGSATCPWKRAASANRNGLALAGLVFGGALLMMLTSIEREKRTWTP